MNHLNDSYKRLDVGFGFFEVFLYPCLSRKFVFQKSLHYRNISTLASPAKDLFWETLANGTDSPPGNENYQGARACISACRFSFTTMLSLNYSI
jgi:hypothetical protein